MTQLNTAINLPVTSDEATVNDYFQLLKPRVMSLVIFTGLCGILMAPGHIHPLLGFCAILSIAIGSGASGALNMWFERHTDALMNRTKNRPLPAGRIDADSALAFRIILSIGSVIFLSVTVNLFSGFLLAFTIFFYAGIYTVALKPNTPQNIVIGGASGALPPVIGWAAVTGSTSLEAWILFLIIFLWTPPHFWALALNQKEDYQKAGMPMLPITHGDQATKKQIFLYSVALTLGSLVPTYIGMNSVYYGAIALILGAYFITLSVQLLRNQTINPMKLFKYSIFYLFTIFLCLTLDKLFLL